MRSVIPHGAEVSIVEEATGNASTHPKEISANAWYYSAKTLDEICVLGVNPFLTPE